MRKLIDLIRIATKIASKNRLAPIREELANAMLAAMCERAISELYERIVKLL